MSKGKPPTGYRPCVGIMLFNGKGQVFVAQRIDSPGPAWQMPQGGIDPGEAPSDAALRELEEEIGTANAEIAAELEEWISYDLPDHLIGKLWGGRYRGQSQKWFAMRFHGADSEIDLDTKHPEFSSWKWVDPDQLVDLAVPFKRHVYQRLIEAFVGGLVPRQ